MIKVLYVCGCIQWSCWGMIDESNTGSFSNKFSSTDWITHNKELINRACYEEQSFDLLVDKIAKYSDDVNDRKKLCEEIEETWNDENEFGMIVLDDGKIGSYRGQRFDF